MGAVPERSTDQPTPLGASYGFTQSIAVLVGAVRLTPDQYPDQIYRGIELDNGARAPMLRIAS